ncbi:MAG: TonB-dependent receptor [Bacteroidota bacterium]
MKFSVEKNTIVLSILFTLFFGGVYAQDAYISGVITDKATGETLIGANVVLEGTIIGVSTDLDGSYILSGVTPGDYNVSITYIGYEDVVKSISLKAGEKLKLDVSLGYGGAVGLDEVIVTAQAKGQMNAINQQLNSQSITNVVSAEKMQELPDANAAETLGRLPGVSVNRVGGEGNKVVVRGLSPKYNRITMEGVQMASSGDDRSTDISAISPYALDGIEVYKAATADKNGEFIGGMVEFKLREARSGWNSDLVAQMGYNDLKGTFSDYLINGSVSNRFFDDQLGVYLQANAEKRNRSANGMTGSYEMKGNPDPALTGQEVLTTGASLTDVFRQKERLGGTLVLDYRLEEGSIKFKNFYSGSNTSKDTYGEVVNSNFQGKLYTDTRTGQRARYESQSFSNILSYSQVFNKLKVEGKVSHTYSKSETPYQIDAYYLQDANVFEDDFIVTRLDQHITPSEVLDNVQSDETISYLQKITERSSVNDERQLGASFDLTYNFNINENLGGFVKAGVDSRKTTRSKDQTAWGSDLIIRGGRNTSQLWEAIPELGSGSGPIPFERANDPDFDHRDYMDGRYSMGSVVDLDLMERMLDVMQANGENGDQYPYDRTSKTDDYSGDELYLASYILTELNIGKSIKFIPGVRYEKNKTEYSGAYGITDLALPERVYPSIDSAVTRENSYLLPMIHLKYKPNDWFDVRLAYTHTLARPNYYQFAPKMDKYMPGQLVNYNNHNLVPEFSKNWDVYFSFHSNQLGLLTVGGFTKEIENMIFNTGRRVILDPSEYGFDDSYKNMAIYTAKNSKDIANMYGLEFDWQSNFYFLPGALKGLVMNINYTHIFSEAQYPYTIVTKELVDPSQPWLGYVTSQEDFTYTGNLVDQPEDIINVGLGYDYKGFSTRISMMYQSKIFKSPNRFRELNTYNEEYLRWDFSAKQKLPWHGLELYTNINNFTSAKEITVVSRTGYDSGLSNYGMTVDFGLRWRL